MVFRNNLVKVFPGASVREKHRINGSDMSGQRSRQRPPGTLGPVKSREVLCNENGPALTENKRFRS
jgi:hypothetical protein